MQNPDAKPLLWKIPVTLVDVSKSESPRVELLEGKTTTVAFASCDAAIKANPGDVGYYRVWYAAPMFEKLKSRFNSLPPADRVNMLGDAWAMVEANRAPATSYLELVSVLRDEKTTGIWETVIGRLMYLDLIERGLPGRAAFRQFAMQLLRPQLERLGWDAAPGEAAPVTHLRNTVIYALGAFGDNDVIAVARTRFQKFLAQPASLAPTLKPTVLAVVGRHSDRVTYEQIHALAVKAQGTEERQVLYGALASALDPALAASTLQVSLTDETVPQEAIALVPEVANGGEQPELAWKFTQEHLAQLLGRSEEFVRNTYVPGVMVAFSDAERADELEKFVREKVSPRGAAKAKESAEAIRLKAALKQRELPGIDHWIPTQLHLLQ